MFYLFMAGYFTGLLTVAVVNYVSEEYEMKKVVRRGRR